MQNDLMQVIKDKLDLMQINNQLEPVKATIYGGNKLYTERIKNSSKYLSHLRKVIYDVKFEKCYYHNGKIPEGCFAVDNEILRIEDQITICFDEDFEKFLEILNRPNPEPIGMRFYVDGVLYMKDVPFLRSDRIRDEILHHRHDGTMIYDILRIVDPSGNTTEFHASPAVAKRMAVARSKFHKLSMIAHD